LSIGALPVRLQLAGGASFRVQWQLPLLVEVLFGVSKDARIP
jgi:hypothetical protein